MKSSPGFTNAMNECPLEHYASFTWLKKDSVGDFTYAQLSVRGRRVLDPLLVLLRSELKLQSTSHVSSFPPALLFSICDALQLDHVGSSAEQNDPSVLPSVLSKLRDWRLLDPDHRYSPGGIHKLALDLAAITDEPPASPSSDPNRASHARLRVKWVSSDSPRASQERGSCSGSSRPPPPSRSGIPDSAQACAHALPDVNKRRSDAGFEFHQAGRLGTPDSEDAGSAVSSRHRSFSGFRSGCSACRHLRLSQSGPTPTPPSPRKTSMPLHDVNRFDASTTTSTPFTKYPVSHASPRKPRREKRRASSSQPIVHGTHIDENEPPAVQQSTGISFPRQRTHSPRISNAILSREPFSPAAASASVQRRREPAHLVHQSRQGDKRTTSHRLASVDLRLSMAHPRPSDASSNDLHPPTRAQSFSRSPDTSRSHRIGSVGAVRPKPSSNAVQSRSGMRLPPWTRTHPATTTSMRPTGSASPTPAKVGSTSTQLLPLGVRSRPSSTSIPPSLQSDVRHRDRRSASAKTHKYASSVPILPISASPLIHARKRQA